MDRNKQTLSLRVNRPGEIAIRDRRTGRDRREASRFAVNIEIFWESIAGTQSGTISDISTIGCYVLCSGEVIDGESIKIHIPLMSGEKVELWGEVVNHVFEMGFGLRFIELGKTQQLFLEKLTLKLNQRNQIKQRPQQ
jgi:hypothetical protein